MTASAKDRAPAPAKARKTPASRSVSNLPTTAPESAAAETASPLARREPDVRFRMRVIQDDTVALGPGKVSLLEAVRDHGSISAAARSIGMSYRRAWLLMDELNRALESPATVSEHGGQSGGGSTLTPVGEEIIRLYRGIEARAAAACAPEIAALTKLVKG